VTSLTAKIYVGQTMFVDLRDKFNSKLTVGGKFISVSLDDA